MLETCEYLKQTGFEVTYLNVDGFGSVDPDDVRKAISDRTALISIMHANNEVGTLNDLAEIAGIARQHRVLFHSDAVQTFGRLPISVSKLGVDLLSISAHKIYGPKGIGALYVRRGVKMERLIHGGGQERGWRAGTENVPLAVGFAAAAALMEQEREPENQRLAQLKIVLQNMLRDRFSSVLFNGHPDR